MIWLAVIGGAIVLVAVVVTLAMRTTPRGIERTNEGLHLKASTVIRAPVEEVWKLWTTDGGRPPFGGEGLGVVLAIDPQPGGRWCFRMGDSGFPGACGRVLAMQEPRRLELSFKACDLTDKPHRLAWTFEPTNDGTHVTMIMDHFESSTLTFKRFDRANALLLAGMRDSFEGNPPTWQVRVYYGFFFEFLGRALIRVMIKVMKESRSCHDDTDYLGDLEVEGAAAGPGAVPGDGELSEPE